MDTIPQKSMDLIWPELVTRFWAPCKSVTFYAHLFFGVILCGGAGIFVTFLKSQWRVEDISAALLGYFPALFGAAVLQFTGEVQPYLRFFSYIAFCVFAPVAIIVSRTEHGWQLFWSLAGAILSILFWWVANGLDKRFDDVEPQSALGGDLSGKLPQSQDKEWKK
jgi:hypothetical protein